MRVKAAVMVMPDFSEVSDEPGNIWKATGPNSMATPGGAPVIPTPEPPAPFSDDTEVAIQWETGTRCYVQIDGFDVVVLNFTTDASTVAVQVWDRLHGDNPAIASEVEVKFHD